MITQQTRRIDWLTVNVGEEFEFPDGDIILVEANHIMGNVTLTLLVDVIPPRSNA